MNRREKILAGSVGGILALLLLGYGVKVVFLTPLRELDKRIALARERIGKVQAERRNYFAAEDRLKAITRTTFADTVDQASARSGEMLTRQILAAGLEESDFTRLPVGPRKLRGASEIGWNVQGDGTLTNVVNLLFLLNHSPWLHRADNLTVSTGDAPGMVRVRFRYLTLVLEPAPDVERTNLVPALTLDSPERHLLNSIVSRDLLRPYIKRPPAPPQPGQPAPMPSRPGVPPGPEVFRVVSLSEWNGEPEIHIRDLSAQKTLRYRVGDELAGGRIALVDYRPMPMPGNSLLLSHSRLILELGGEFWAVERGRTLADKHRLSDAELPVQLARKP
ncbi:MAG: hypothetical protein RIS76_1291 [Verrucomicrobiota bacterium]